MTAVAAPAFPAPARRLSLRGGLRNTFTLTWRSVLKIRTNLEDLLGLSLQPIMYLLLFTYVFGGAIASRKRARTCSSRCRGSWSSAWCSLPWVPA